MSKSKVKQKRKRKIRKIKGQPGMQIDVLSSRADITICGGAAGSGKTFTEILDPVRHSKNSKFRGIMFRRTTPELTMPGGLIDTARELYGPMRGKFRMTPGDMACTLPSGWSLSFAHLQYEHTKFKYQGLQAAWAGFDELTHFSKTQFMYIFTRLRSMAGVEPRVIASCNPDPDSWVKEVIRWWLDEEGRYADPKKSGVVRFFIVDEETDQWLWFDSREEIAKLYDQETADDATSLTFTPGKLDDNKILLKKDKKYRGKLKAQDKVTRARLLKGDWKVKAAAGTYFDRSMFEMVDAYEELADHIAFYDRAATEYIPGKTYKVKKKPNGKDSNTPDYTARVRMGVIYTNADEDNKQFVITHLWDARKKAADIEKSIKNFAKQDGKACRVGTFQDPGGAGKGEADRFVSMLSGYQVSTVPATQSKEINAKTFAAQVQVGNVKIWSGVNKEALELFFQQLESFPDPDTHDDYVDAASGAFNCLFDDEGEFYVF